MMIAVLAFGRAGAAAALLDLRLTQIFGRISYSFYLLHPLTWTIINGRPEL